MCKIMNATYRNIAFLLISTTILLAQAQDGTHSNITVRNRFTCPEQSTIPDCICDESPAKIEFYCERLSRTLYVAVLGELKTSLQCIGENPYDFETVPNLAIGDAGLLKVEDCPLDEDQPILQTFEFLGVMNVKSLMYKNYYKGIHYTSRYFEGLQQLENLTLARGVDSIDKNTFSANRGLKKLVVEHTNVELQPGVFKHLRNLTYLALDYNQIDELKPGLFDGLENLEKLSLAHNSIKNLRSGTFNGLKSLRRLNLRVNNIEAFDIDIFAPLTELTMLDVTLCPFVSLPTELLAVNKKLKTIVLMNNRRLTTLPEELLANLPELKTVDLSRNEINNIPNYIFRGSSEISELNLGHNKLVSLPEELLSDQQQLQTLELDHNQLEVIPDYFLEKTRELQTLDLSYNRLRSFSEKTFASLRHLKVLHLENNQLQTITQFSSDGTPNLEELYMQNNQLALHADDFKNEHSIAENDNTPFQVLSKLRILHLRNNSISTIYQDWYMNTIELQDLDLSFNKLTNLTIVELQFRSNISVNLSNNEIGRVFLYDLKINPNQKIIVDLNNNPLNCDCNVLKFVQLVQAKPDHGLQFSTDHLRCAEPRNLLGLSMDQLATKDLLCDFNTHSECPAGCHCSGRLLDHTVVVNCSDRGLTEIPQLPIPSQISEGFNALELHVENNRLAELPLTNLTGYNEVTRLFARNNSIRELLPGSIPAKLQEMDLSQNHLQMIDNSTLEALHNASHLGSIRLSQNQWRCDCDASGFLIFVQQNSRLISDIAGVQCHPSGKSLDSITFNELCYKDYTLKIVICVMVAILGLLAGVISTLFFRYQTEVKVWLFTHNLFLSFITEEELDKDKLYDAFISYSHLDEEFIAEELIPTLEKEPMNFKTCWHVRDFMPGEMIMTQIINSIEASRRTMIVLSKNFLESNWAKQEFRQAHIQSMEDNRVRVIVVIYEDVGDIESLDSELKAYLKTNTYVKWGDPWFWRKLRYAMPHPLKVRGIRSAVSDIHLQQVTPVKPTVVFVDHSCPVS